jgi:hypothetical protein
MILSKYPTCHANPGLTLRIPREDDAFQARTTAPRDTGHIGES